MKPKTVLNKSSFLVRNHRKKDIIAIKSEFMQFDPEYLFQNAIKTNYHYLYVKNCSCFICGDIRNRTSTPFPSL